MIVHLDRVEQATAGPGEARDVPQGPSDPAPDRDLSVPELMRRYGIGARAAYRLRANMEGTGSAG